EARLVAEEEQHEGEGQRLRDDGEVDAAYARAEREPAEDEREQARRQHHQERLLEEGLGPVPVPGQLLPVEEDHELGQDRIAVHPYFMVFLDWKELPWYWHGSESFLQQALLVVLAPCLLAFVFGWFAFRSRIRGVYFSIITQALTFAFMLLFFRNQTGFGGNNGFTDFKRILGFPIASPRTKVALFVLSATALLGALLLCRSL